MAAVVRSPSFTKESWTGFLALGFSLVLTVTGTVDGNSLTLKHEITKMTISMISVTGFS